MHTLLKMIWLGGASMMSFSACDKDNNNYTWEPPEKPVYELYHLPRTGWVGDVMPYFQDGRFMIYYLNDATNREKQSSPGEHPIFALSTSNLVDVIDEGEVIPYGNRNTQDHLIGTGAMIEETGGTSYFYYTGHNGSSSWLSNNNPAWATPNPREAVMLATRINGQSWQKQLQPIITAPAGFDRNDFRDPYVFFNEEFNTYWMLISTRHEGRGVLLTYTNADPANDPWVQGEVLDVEGDFLMLECADIFKVGDLYYLLFAEDWSDHRGTHYRVASSTKGPWRKPIAADDRLDGHHFYAAKTASDGTKRYGFGWAHRRTPETDNGSLTWAGNLITHEVYTLANGKLGVRAPDTFLEHVAQQEDVVVIDTEGAVDQSGAPLRLDGRESNAKVVFDTLVGTKRIDMQLDWAGEEGTLGFQFADGGYEILLDKSTGRISGRQDGNETTHVFYDLQDGGQLAARLVIDGSIIVLYVNDEIALTNRSYGAQGQSWAIVAGGTTLTVADIKMLTK